MTRVRLHTDPDKWPHRRPRWRAYIHLHVGTVWPGDSRMGYMHIHVGAHTGAHAHTPAYTHTHMHTPAHMCLSVVLARTFTYMVGPRRTCAHTRAHIAHVHTCTYTHTHARTCAYTCAHVRTREHLVLRCAPLSHMHLHGHTCTHTWGVQTTRPHTPSHARTCTHIYPHPTTCTYTRLQCVRLPTSAHMHLHVYPCGCRTYM